MLLFLNTNKSLNELIGKDKYSKRYFNIELDTSFSLPEYIDTIYNSLQLFKDKAIISFTSLTDCIINTEESSNNFELLYKQFLGILELAVEKGHEILILNDPYENNSFVNELDNIDGVEIITSTDILLSKITEDYI